MAILNPNIPIRQALIASLTAATNLPVWHKKVPKNTTPVPSKYILLQSEGKRRTAISKGAWEWECNITIDITYINQQGYSNTVQVDDVEQLAINAIEPDEDINYLGFTMPGWFVKSIELIDSTDLDDENTTQSVERRILTYNFWVWPVA